MRFSSSAAMPLKSVPITIGTGLPITAIIVGRSSSQAATTRSTSLSSSPSTASISRSPEQNVRAGASYQRGSS